MGLFSSSTDKKFALWNELNSEAELNRLLSLKDGSKHLIFKHSTRCGISSMALRQFESAWKDSSEIKLWYLDLLSYRDLSGKIAQKLNVQHQSPQALLFQDGQVLYHSSHHSIDATTIQNEFK